MPYGFESLKLETIRFREITDISNELDKESARRKEIMFKESLTKKGLRNPLLALILVMALLIAGTVVMLFLTRHTAEAPAHPVRATAAPTPSAPKPDPQHDWFEVLSSLESYPVPEAVCAGVSLHSALQ